MVFLPRARLQTGKQRGVHGKQRSTPNPLCFKGRGLPGYIYIRTYVCMYAVFMCVHMLFNTRIPSAMQKKSTNGKTRFLPFVHSIEICSFCLRIWHTGICWHIFGTDWVSEIENAWWGVNIVNKWREKCAVLTWTVANTYNTCSMSHDSWICLLEFPPEMCRKFPE